MLHRLLPVLTPLIGLAINALVQISVFRLNAKLGLLKSVFTGFAGGMLSVIVIAFYELPGGSGAGDSLFVLIANIIVYSALGYCYFHFINLGETARRIRILRELYDAKEGLTSQEILGRYNAQRIIDLRLKRLLKNGQITYKNGRYYIGSPVMRMIGSVIVMMKIAIIGKASEFD